MQALIFDGPDQLRLDAWPLPSPAPGEVVVRVRTTTICGTDVRIVSGRKTREVRRGHPIGHECAGTVAAIGEGVTRFVVGDRVAVHPVITCGACEYCLADRENLCAQRYTLGYATDGSFADSMRIPARAVAHGNLFKLPPQIPLEVASVLEPAGCCLNGQHEMALASVTAGGKAHLLVMGAGPIGLLHVMLARALPEPPARIVVLEPRAHRRAAALRLGADEAVDPAEFGGTDAFHAVIMAAGIGGAVNVALRAAHKEGRVNLFAGFDAGAAPPVDVNAIHYKQLHISGASESRRRDFAEALSLALDGRLDLGAIVTHRYTIDQYEEAFAAAADGTALKVAFDFPD